MQEMQENASSAYAKNVGDFAAVGERLLKRSIGVDEGCGSAKSICSSLCYDFAAILST